MILCAVRRTVPCLGVVVFDCCGDEFQQPKRKLQLSNSKGRKKTAAEHFVETVGDNKLTRMEKAVSSRTLSGR